MTNPTDIERGARALRDQAVLESMRAPGPVTPADKRQAQAVLDADTEKGWECRWALEAEAKVRELEIRVKKLRRWALQAEARARELEARVKELEEACREGHAALELLASHLSEDDCAVCVGDGLDYEGDEWTLCECVERALTAARSEGSDA